MVPEWLDLAAIVVGALAGVLAAQERKLDLVGFVALCLICSLGGGILRDCIMQVGPAYALTSKWAIPAAVLTALVGFAFPSAITRHPTLYEFVDIISVGLYVVAGADKAVAYGLSAPAVVLMGTITGVGGGMLRDVFLGEVPQVFRRSNLYAFCAILGSVTYYVCLRLLHLDLPIVTVATLVAVVALRRVSLRLDIKSPSSVDLTPKVKDARRRVIEGIRPHK